MTLAGWKRTPGTGNQPVGTVAPIVPDTPPAVAELPQTGDQVEPNEFVVAEFVDSHFGQPFDAAPPVPTAASEDLERALAEMDGIVEPDPVALEPQPMAPFGSAQSFGAPGGSVPPAQTPAFGQSVPAPVFGQTTVVPSYSTGSPTTPTMPPPPSFTPSFAPSFAPSVAPSFVPGSISPNEPASGFSQPHQAFASAPAPGLHLAPGGAPVPPVYAKTGSSAGKTVGIVIAIVLGLLLVLCVGLVAAVSLLGNKVNSTFNAITISNTLPAGFGSYDPYATDPYATDPYATDPYATDPYATDPAVAPSTIASPYTDLTGYEAMVGKQPYDFIGRNTAGPVFFPLGEGCVVFEVGTQSYGAFRCDGGRMNAQLVLAGEPATVTEKCQSTATARAGREISVADLWLVNYDNGQAECFVRKTPEWGMSLEPILPITAQ